MTKAIHPQVTTREAEDRVQTQLDRLWRGMPAVDVEPRRAALVVHDMQRMTTDLEGGLARRMLEAGLVELRRNYLEAIEDALPRMVALRDACRAAGIQVIYTMLASSPNDAYGCAHSLRQHGLLPTVGTPDATPDSRLSPLPTEPVITRGTFSMLATAHGGAVTRNMDIRTLILIGAFTDLTLESTGRDASDQGYRTIVVADACISVSPAWHQRGLENLRLWYAWICSTGQLLGRLAASGEG